jgi:hypothetical protein
MRNRCLRELKHGERRQTGFAFGKRFYKIGGKNERSG